ncbi:MAG: DUF5615 family PIN-like protein [Verrucomicrobiia bacterium]
MKLLTDEHFPSEIATAVRRQMPNCDIQSIHETNLAGLLDQPLLEVLDVQQRTLLTRDVNSIPDFLKERLREGRTHGGVIYVSGAFRQNDLRAVVRALVTFLKAHGDEGWGCREGWL